MEKRFSASKGQSVWLITGGVLIILLTIVARNYFPIFSDEELGFSFMDYALILMFIALLLGTWVYSVLSYTLTADSLSINRPVGKKSISISEIKSTRKLAKEEMGTMLRKFGNGGLFGFYGKFWSSNLGNLNFFATRRNKLVLIELKNGKKYVITPDEDGEIVNEINLRIN